MSIANPCHRCGRWHDTTVSCVAAAGRPPVMGIDQARADAQENAAIERFRRRDRSGR